jgi:hypothetical protein
VEESGELFVGGEGFVKGFEVGGGASGGEAEVVEGGEGLCGCD